MSEPIRVQRKRTKGWKMPENTVYVGRPSQLGNPFKSGDNERAVKLFRQCVCRFPVQGHNINCWRDAGGSVAALVGIASGVLIKDLRGKNLACWCPIDQPCHADVLLELANSPDPER